MRYDFKCSRCGNVEEVNMRMSDIGKVPVYCMKCTDVKVGDLMTSPQKDLSVVYLKTEDAAILGLSEMHRIWTTDGLHTAQVTDTVGSWLDKNKKQQSRPKEFFQEQTRKLQQETAHRQREECKVAGTLADVNKKRSNAGLEPL